MSEARAAAAANLGGGLDLGAGRRFSIRLVEADYPVTIFDNAVNNRRNNLCGNRDSCVLVVSSV
jgi:hypothetical protein